MKGDIARIQRGGQEEKNKPSIDLLLKKARAKSAQSFDNQKSTLQRSSKRPNRLSNKERKRCSCRKKNHWGNKEKSKRTGKRRK